MNDYLRDRAMRRGRSGDNARGRGRDYARGGRGRNDYARGELYRNDYANDMRNPYGARGGYVRDSRLEDEWRRPFNEQDYQETRFHGEVQPIGYEEREEQDSARGRGRSRDYRGGDYRNDYRNDYNDYENDYAMDFAKEDEDWKKHLKKWCEELKHYDKFNMPKDQVINQARQMKVKFNNYNEEEFYVTYLMKISDDEDNLISNPQMAIIMAKNFLEDKDSKLKGSDKLCAYYYEIVKGGE